MNHQLLIGKIFQNYRITEFIKSGGMGSVYRAEHEIINSPAVIKILHPQFMADENVRQRFVQEAKILSKLQHRNIVRLLNFDKTDHGLIIVMDFVQGRTLADMLRDFPKGMTLKQSGLIMIPLLDALQYAHERGVVHRDLKPNNIIVQPNGEPVLLDFGIAKFAEAEMTQYSQVMGTPVYMSPEQILDPRNIDFKSDIYTCGVLLFQLLSGTLPYDPNSSPFHIQQKIVQEPLPELSTLPKAINQIIQKATAKSKDVRFVSTKEMRDALFMEDTTDPDLSTKAPRVTYAQAIFVDDDAENPIDIDEPSKSQALKLEQLEVERKSKEEADILVRLEIVRKEKEAAERKAKEETERLARLEAERKAKEEAERLARLEAERKAKEEAERLARLEAEHKAKEEAERLARLEAERKAKEEAERLARLEAERKAKEEAERLARLEAERKAKEEAERLARLEAERKAKEEAERLARLEAERKAKEEAERLARLEAERKAKEEAERLARLEAERKAKEEAERLALLEVERKAKEEAERLARLEAERKAKEVADKLARIEAERKSKEEAESRAKEEQELRIRKDYEQLLKTEIEHQKKKQQYETEASTVIEYKNKAAVYEPQTEVLEAVVREPTPSVKVERVVEGSNKNIKLYAGIGVGAFLIMMSIVFWPSSKPPAQQDPIAVQNAKDEQDKKVKEEQARVLNAQQEENRKKAEIQAENSAYQQALAENTIPAFENFIIKYSNGANKENAKNKIKALQIQIDSLLQSAKSLKEGKLFEDANDELNKARKINPNLKI